MTRFSMRALGAFLAPLALAAALPVSAAAQTIAVTNGRVITNGEAGVIASGTVLIRDGVIAEVGAQVRIPSGARVIDAQGGWITPGLFHPQTELGLVEVSAETGARDNAASGSTFTAAMDVADSFNPAGNHIAAARVKGVTRFAVHPAVGSAIIAGRGALADASGAPDSLFADRQFMLVDLSVSGARTAGGARSAAWAYLRAAIEDARFYPGRFMAHHEGDAINRFDAAAMVDVARGAMPLIMRMDRASDIRRAIQFAERYPNIRLIIVGGAEAHLMADEIADAGIPVILDPMRNLPESFDTLAASNRAAATLHAAGVQLAYTTLGSDLYWNPRLLRQHAGIAVAHGASWDDAFRAVTLTPAEIYGVADRFGSLEQGKAADVVVWDGDPLEVLSAPTAVLIDGQVTSLETRQTRLRDRYAVLRREGEHGYAH